MALKNGGMVYNKEDIGFKVLTTSWDSIKRKS